MQERSVYRGGHLRRRSCLSVLGSMAVARIGALVRKQQNWVIRVTGGRPPAPRAGMWTTSYYVVTFLCHVVAGISGLFSNDISGRHQV